MTDLDRLAADVDARLRDADAELTRWATFGWSGRQPVHTVYVPADRAHAGIVAEWSERARAKLDLHAPDRAVLAEALNVDHDLVAYDRVVEKLTREPIEDLRIDFEDGYGARSDETEDDHVRAAAAAVRTMLDAGTAPPFFGIRI
ncbi:MAG: aldolase, partial [Actinomycetia bacterium]|nr:aldolase [Actinomycetes bacterium]